MTIVSLPYAYRVVGVARRERSVKTFNVLDEIVVDIPELSSAEVPVGYVRRGHETLQEVVYRAHERRPVLALARPNDGRFHHDRSILDVETLREWHARIMAKEPAYWKTYPIRVPRDWNGLFDRDLLVHGDELFRTVHRNHRDADRDRAMRIASGMVFVDGQLHAPAREPTLVVNRDREANRHFRVAVFPNVFDHAVAGEPFRMSRREDALRFARSITSAEDQLVDNSGMGEDLGLIDWQADDATLSAWNMANAIMSSLAGSTGAGLRWMHESFFGPMCEMRELWREDGPRDRILDAAYRMRGAIELSTDPLAKDLCSLLTHDLKLPLIRQETFEAAPAAEELSGLTMDM